MKTMCAEAGITGNFTNHSGKRTCATQLYQAGVEEQEIMARTGHRSVNSVRKYKRPSEEMMREISNVLEPPTKIKREMPYDDIDETEDEKPSFHGPMFRNCTFNFQK